MFTTRFSLILSVAFLTATLASHAQTTPRITKSSDDAMTFKSNIAELMRLTSTGQLGISTTSPSSTLHVSGTLIISNGGEACDLNREGGVRYNSGNGKIEFCDGAGTWAELGAGGGGGSVSTGIAGYVRVSPVDMTPGSGSASQAPMD